MTSRPRRCDVSRETGETAFRYYFRIPNMYYNNTHSCGGYDDVRNNILIDIVRGKSLFLQQHYYNSLGPACSPLAALSLLRVSRARARQFEISHLPHRVLNVSHPVQKPTLVLFKLPLAVATVELTVICLKENSSSGERANGRDPSISPPGTSTVVQLFESACFIVWTQQKALNFLSLFDC